MAGQTTLTLVSSPTHCMTPRPGESAVTATMINADKRDGATLAREATRTLERRYATTAQGRHGAGRDGHARHGADAIEWPAARPIRSQRPHRSRDWRLGHSDLDRPRGCSRASGRGGLGTGPHKSRNGCSHIATCDVSACARRNLLRPRPRNDRGGLDHPVERGSRAGQLCASPAAVCTGRDGQRHAGGPWMGGGRERDLQDRGGIRAGRDRHRLTSRHWNTIHDSCSSGPLFRASADRRTMRPRSGFGRDCCRRWPCDRRPDLRRSGSTGPRYVHGGTPRCLRRRRRRRLSIPDVAPAARSERLRLCPRAR